MKASSPISLGEENYEDFATRYAAFAETKPYNAYYDRPATLSLLPDVVGKKVLDAGCGPGIYTEWLLNHGAEVVAVDVTPAFVEITRQRVGDRATILRADLQEPLDFAADETFDLVLSPLVLDYIKEWGPLFKEFYRVLKPGGTFVFSCGNPVADWHMLASDEMNYHETELFEYAWRGFGEPVVVIKSYRRPLSATLNPLLRAGFLLETLLEALPTEEFKKADPEDYAKLMQNPAFLHVRARKP